MRVAPAARPSCCPDTLPKAMLECHTAFCAGPDTPAALPCRLLFQGMIVISRAAGGRGAPAAAAAFSFSVCCCCELPPAICYLPTRDRGRVCSCVCLADWLPGTYLQTAFLGLCTDCAVPRTARCTVLEAALTVRSTRCSCQTARPRELADRLTA